MALGYPITVRNVFDDLLLICGVEQANNAPMYIRERVLTDINATLQFIQAAGGDFFNRDVSTTATVSGTAGYALTDVQQVVGPVRIGAIPLRELASRGEFDLYAAMLGALDDVSAASNARPTAYYLQRLRDPANEGTSGESTALTLLLAPTPNAVYSVAAEVVKLARNVSYADLTADVPLPMPHKYVASLFLPIARYNVTTCPWALYRHEGHMAGIQADYTRALALLGVNDPRYLPPVPPRDREKRQEARGTLTLEPPKEMAT